jgi:hypothetical protein
VREQRSISAWHLTQGKFCARLTVKGLRVRCILDLRTRLLIFLSLAGLFVVFVSAQEPPARYSDTVVVQDGQNGPREGQNGSHPIFGKITAVHGGTIELAGPNGQTVTVKVTPQTEFRKDRRPAKASDFKVGDIVMVRGDQNPDNTVTAKTVGGRTAGAGGGPGAAGGGGFFAGGGTLGKDYVMGQVKSIDPPRLTILRTDNVSQTLELTEETTLRRGRESITMADIQVGDHVVAHGAVQNNVFVPKGVMVMGPEQWQRMQDFMSQANGPTAKPATPATPAPKP